ncbi:hypothetical protein GP475_02270 [Corynebacterium poyangense]|uniref:Uncharacterized protein n=1 Tax=Corynebacterium poyangense TaxID=2684405 RepID=A0A7H0SM13_9CORY|nr:hypothetical protein [Corynebacterium poyangense]MBZ8177699.1 hypothetical protein [Corynebacterium poyangense]QNQ89588.1 hypothetical protein GP475_02270 [Corynebacterium poyangense]
MKYYTLIGIALGIALAFLGLAFGFGGLVLGVIFALIGGAVGAHYDGHIDLRQIFDGLRKRD